MFSGSCPGWVFGAVSGAPGCCPGTSEFGVGAVGPGVTGGWPGVACWLVVDTGVTGSRPCSPGYPESSKISRGGITFDQSIPRSALFSPCLTLPWVDMMFLIPSSSIDRRNAIDLSIFTITF